jgi:putative transcriptional regulator
METVEEILKERLAKDIIGEIVLSQNPGQTLRKWRNIFKISQKKLALQLGTTASVISDYESGRRKSPGIGMIKKYVLGLLAIDRSSSNLSRSFISTQEGLASAIMDIKEYNKAVNVADFCTAIDAKLITKAANQTILGYVIIDAVKAITELPTSELAKLYSLATQRALIFTKISRGRTPLVAIKLTGLKPALVILHGIAVVDELGKRIAETEGITLAVCAIENIEEVKERLKKLC